MRHAGPRGTDAGPPDVARPGAAIESEIARDPDVAEILDAFVAGLAGKVDSMRQALAHGNHDELRGLAHQLKGAGGSYGYPMLTEAAGTLEGAAKAKDVEASTLALKELAELCQRAARGRQTRSPAGRAEGRCPPRAEAMLLATARRSRRMC